jgi:hypothetical protein
MEQATSLERINFCAWQEIPRLLWNSKVYTVFNCTSSYIPFTGVTIPAYSFPYKQAKQQEIPLQALTGPGGSRRLRLPDILRQSAHEGGKVVSPMHLPPLPPGNIPSTNVC